MGNSRPESRNNLKMLIKYTGAFMLGVLIGIVLFLVVLAGMTAVAVWSGKVSFICFAGLIWVAISYGVFNIFQGAKKTTDWFQTKIQQARELNEKLHNGDSNSFLSLLLITIEVLAAIASQFSFFSMGVVADIAEVAVKTHMHFVQASIHAAVVTPPVSMPVFGKHLSISTVPLILSPIVGFIADSLNRTHEQPGKSGRAVMYFATFAFVTGVCVLFCGLWGAATFHAAQNIFTPSLETILAGVDIMGPLSEYQQNEALVLYHIQGKYIFYLLFAVCPLWWFFTGLSEHIGNKQSKNPSKRPPEFTLAGRTYMAAFWLLVLAGTLALRLHFANPIDIELFTCQTQFAGQPELVGCYQKATSEWETELNKDDKATLVHLNNMQKEEAFLKNDKQWKNKEENHLVALDKKMANRPDKQLILAEDRLDATKARLEEVSHMYVWSQSMLSK